MAEVPMNRDLVPYNNSFAAKSSLAQNREEKKEIPKMETDISIRGQAIVRRKTPGQRFSEMFLNNTDLRTVFGTIATEIIVPGLKEMFFNGITDTFSMLLWGEPRSNPSRGVYRTGGGIVRDYTNYNSISSGRYRNKPDPVPAGPVGGTRYYDVIFTSSAAAHSVLGSMRAYINRYQSLPVLALCDFIKAETGIQIDTSHMDADKGWTDLTGIDVYPRYGGWILSYTDPVQLESEEYRVQR